MKRFLVLFVALWMLCGCTSQYKEEEFYNDVYETLNIEYTGTVGNKVITNQFVASFLKDVCFLDDFELESYHYFTSEELKKEIKLTRNQTLEILNQVKDQLIEETYLEPEFEEIFKENYQELSDISQLEEVEDGFYYVQGSFYKKENGIYYEQSLEDVYESFDYQGTFVPDLEESVIFPEGVTIDENPELFEPLSFKEGDKASIEQLASKYFHFTISGIKVTGRLFKSGLELSLYSEKYFGMELSNSFKLSNFNVTANIHYQKDSPYALIKADYDIIDRLSLEKEYKTNISGIPLDLTVLKSLENKLNSLNLEPAKAKLDLLKFNVPVPNTLGKVKMEVALQLEFSLTGIANLTFSASNHQSNVASNSYQGLVGKNTWSIEPYVEGDCDVASNLDLSCYLGNYLVADAYIGSGVGASATTQLYYVNQKEKEVLKQECKASLTAIKDELSNYITTKEAYIDTCQDVNIYYFVKGGIGDQSKGLFRKIGLSYDFTPLKNTYRIYHFENHHVVDKCTRSYDLFNQDSFDENWQLNTYELYLMVGESYQLSVENYEGQVTWSSSNTSVAIVENGLVRIIGEGNCIIEAQDEKGNISQCVIIVDKGNEIEFNPLSC